MPGDPGPPVVTEDEIRAELGPLFEIVELREFRFTTNKARFPSPRLVHLDATAVSLLEFVAGRSRPTMRKLPRSFYDRDTISRRQRTAWETPRSRGSCRAGLWKWKRTSGRTISRRIRQGD